MLLVTLKCPTGDFTMNATGQAADMGTDLTTLTALEVTWQGLTLVRIPFVVDGDPLDVIGALRAEIADLREQLAGVACYGSCGLPGCEMCDPIYD